MHIYTSSCKKRPPPASLIPEEHHSPPTLTLPPDAALLQAGGVQSRTRRNSFSSEICWCSVAAKAEAVHTCAIGRVFSLPTSYCTVFNVLFMHIYIFISIWFFLTMSQSSFPLTPIFWHLILMTVKINFGSGKKKYFSHFST